MNVAQLNTWYRVGLYLLMNTTQLDTKYRVGLCLRINTAQLDTRYRVGLNVDQLDTWSIELGCFYA